MKKHALVLSLLLAAATVAGVVALTQTVALGQATPTTSTSEIERREAALDQARQDIARLDASVPPALPPSTASAPTAPQPVVVVSTSSAGDDSEWNDDDHDGDGHSDGHDHDDDDDHGEGWDD